MYFVNVSNDDDEINHTGGSLSKWPATHPRPDIMV